MKTFFTTIALIILSLPVLVGQNDVQVDASSNWVGFMNVFNLDGSYNFGSPWAVANLKTTLDTDANTVTLQPNFNTYADNPGDDFWIDPVTGEGAKDMEASTFVEPGESFNGNDLTFSGTIEAFTIDTADYSVKFFIKALDPNDGFQDALGGAKIFDLPMSGEFSVSATAAELAAGLVVQYGFSVTGRNADPADEATLGSVIVAGEMVSTGANNVQVDASDSWTGFMNVFNLDGSYNFGSPWAVADLKTTLDTDANTVTLQPNFNTYADNPGDDFWIDPVTGEGAKDMEASTFVEPGASFNGNDLTFSGTVEAFTVDTADYSVKFFIKALDPENGFQDALGGAKIFDLPMSGEFTVSATAAELPAGLVVQYGFSVTGRNANPADEASLGSVVIGGEMVSTGENNVQADASDNWTGFMNVFNLDGSYNFGSPWGVADLKTTLDLDPNRITLQPNFNTYADNPGDPFWVDQVTGEGAKDMEALTFVEPGASFNGNDLTFSGSVESFTVDTAAYSVKFFIKALDPENGFQDALAGAKTFDLPMSGAFTVSATAEELPAGLLIQYGFSVTGRNANPADEATLGSVVIGAGSVSTTDLNDQSIQAIVYPNPVSDILSIQSESQVKSYQVVTLMGQTVLSGLATNDIDVSGLTTGNYFIMLQLEAGNRVLRFIKR